jgi:hypothetical protein
MGNQDPLLAWWLGLTLSQLLMLGMSLPDAQASPQPRHDDVPLRSYFSSAGPIIGGAAWGALALVGPYDASPQSQAILCVVLCSVTLAGTGFSRSVSSYSAFAATVLLPLFILLVASPPARVPGAAFWLLAFAAFALIVRSLHTGREGPPQDSLGRVRNHLDAPPGHGRQRPRRHRAVPRQPGRTVQPALCRDDARRRERHRRPACWMASRAGPTGTITPGPPIRRSGVAAPITPRRLRRRDGSVFWAEITGQAIDPESHPPQVVWVAFRRDREDDGQRPRGAARPRSCAR